MGMHREDIDRLFSDYTQLDAMANRKVEGTGLGLAIAKKIVEMMDGSIAVESEYGKGSTFTVCFIQGLLT
jgi:signal transduction histidine kinase